MGSTNVSSLATQRNSRQPPTRAGRGNSPAGKARRRLKDGGDPGEAGTGRSWAEGDRHMSNRILKAPLVAVTALLAMAAIPAVAQAGGGTYPTPDPEISLDKTGAATANAGDTFTYSFAVTNTGNVTLTNVELTDDKCQDTLVQRPGRDRRRLRPRVTCGTTRARWSRPRARPRCTTWPRSPRSTSYKCQTKTVDGDRRPHVHRPGADPAGEPAGQPARERRRANPPANAARHPAGDAAGRRRRAPRPGDLRPCRAARAERLRQAGVPRPGRPAAASSR